MRRLLLSLALVAFAAVPSARAQSAAGEWNATMNTPGGPSSFKVILQVKGDSLSGTVKRRAGDSPLSGTVRGQDIAFWYTIDYNGNALAMTVTAKLTGDEMKGTVDMNGNATEEFAARRAARRAATPRYRMIAPQMSGNVALLCPRYCGRNPYNTACPFPLATSTSADLPLIFPAPSNQPLSSGLPVAA